MAGNRVYPRAFLEQARATVVASQFHAGINAMEQDAMRVLSSARDGLATESIPDITGYQLPTFEQVVAGGIPGDAGQTEPPPPEVSPNLVPEDEIPMASAVVSAGMTGDGGGVAMNAPPGGGVAAANGLPPIDHSSRVAFLRSAAPYAVMAEQQTGIPAEVVMSVALLEGSWQAEPPGHNYFGIKGANPRTGATTGAVGTNEEVGGQMVRTSASFRAYDHPGESFADFGNFLRSNSRYGGALNVLQRTGDPYQFIDAVGAAGYATDSRWSQKVKSIASEIGGLVQDARARLAGGGGG